MIEHLLHTGYLLDSGVQEMHKYIFYLHEIHGLGEDTEIQIKLIPKSEGKNDEKINNYNLKMISMSHRMGSKTVLRTNSNCRSLKSAESSNHF